MSNGCKDRVFCLPSVRIRLRGSSVECRSLGRMAVKRSCERVVSSSFALRVAGPNGILTSINLVLGETHRRNRKFVQPAFGINETEAPFPASGWCVKHVRPIPPLLYASMVY